MPPNEIADRDTDIVGAITTLRRRAGLILLCVVITAAAAVGFSLFQQKQYSAAASLLFRDPGFAQSLFGNDAASTSPDPSREAATNQELVGLEVVAARTSKALEGRLSPSQVSGMVEVSSNGESDVVAVTATDASPALATKVANTFSRQFISFRADTDQSKLLEAKLLADREFRNLPPDQQQGIRGGSLARAAEKLGVLASLQTGNAELVQPASLPGSPSSPKPMRNGVLGALLGLFLGVGLAFLFERLNRTLREPEEAREVFDLPVLGTVPESKTIALSNQPGTKAADLPFAEEEAFRTLRASLRYFNVDHDMRSVLVTSYAAGVGKTTVAWNLARVAATSSRVVLVEGDLRRPQISKRGSLKLVPGLAELLTHQVDLEDVIQSSPANEGSESDTGDRGTGLDVIVAGATPPNPAELIESQTMNETLSQLTERYDLVIIDTPPTGAVSDSFPLLQRVDGIIAVVRMGESTRESAERLREQLARLEAPVLGLVANGMKLRRGKYGYGYGYGTYGQPNSAETADNSI